MRIYKVSDIDRSLLHERNSPSFITSFYHRLWPMSSNNRVIWYHNIVVYYHGNVIEMGIDLLTIVCYCASNVYRQPVMIHLMRGEYMTPFEQTAIIVAVLGCAAILALSAIWLAWYDNRQAKKQLEHDDIIRNARSRYDVRSKDWLPPGLE